MDEAYRVRASNFDNGQKSETEFWAECWYFCNDKPIRNVRCIADSEDKARIGLWDHLQKDGFRLNRPYYATDDLIDNDEGHRECVMNATEIWA